MDERGHPSAGRRAARSLGRFSIPRPERWAAPARFEPAAVMDELVVHPEKILHLLLRRRALRLLSRACLVATPWCREQQLLQPRHVLRWDAQVALLSSLGKGFDVGARLTAFVLQAKSRTPAPPKAAAPLESATTTDELRNPATRPRTGIRTGGPWRPFRLEVKHVVRPDRAPHDQVPG